MALSERNRASLYRGLSAIIEEEAVSEMLSAFPTQADSEVATKDFVRAEIAEVRAEVAQLRSDMHAESNRLLLWMVGYNTGLAGVVLAVVRLF